MLGNVKYEVVVKCSVFVKKQDKGFVCEVLVGLLLLLFWWKLGIVCGFRRCSKYLL